MPAIPLTCSQCGGPHEKDDHHCSWCRTAFSPSNEDEDDCEDWEDFERELHQQMDEEDAAWARMMEAIRKSPDSAVSPDEEINWGAWCIGAALGIWALYSFFGWS
jgi:hypothetical protein